MHNPQANIMTLDFQSIKKADIPALTEVMTRSFDNDAQTHLGKERGGPPGYDDGEFFRKWLFGYEESIGYKILSTGRLIGGLIVWVFPSGENNLGVIFVDPEYQDCGVGTEIWQFVEDTYPNANSWQLETPEWALKNHFFYEQKCGFQKIDHREDSFVYKKVM